MRRGSIDWTCSFHERCTHSVASMVSNLDYERCLEQSPGEFSSCFNFVPFLDEYVNLTNPNQLITACFCRGIQDWPRTPWTCSIEFQWEFRWKYSVSVPFVEGLLFSYLNGIGKLTKMVGAIQTWKRNKRSSAFSDSIRSLPTRVSIGRFNWWVIPHRHQNSPEIIGLCYDQRPTMKAFVKAGFCLAIAPITVGYMVKMNQQLTTVESVYIDLKLHILSTFQHLLQPWFKNMLIIMAILMLRMYNHILYIFFIFDYNDTHISVYYIYM